MALSERWVQETRNILERVEKLAAAEGKDRLDLVRSIRFSLHALQRSVVGWLTWGDNPDVMVKFSFEELREVNDVLAKFAKSFIEYDIEATERRAGLPKRRKKREREEFYA